MGWRVAAPAWSPRFSTLEVSIVFGIWVTRVVEGAACGALSSFPVYLHLSRVFRYPLDAVTAGRECASSRSFDNLLVVSVL